MINKIPLKESPKIDYKNPSINFFSKKEQQEVEKLNKEKIVFSYKFLDITHESFNCGQTTIGWFLMLLEQLKSISDLTFNEFYSQRQHYDIHPHDFSKTKHNYNESVHIDFLEQLSPENLFQFRLTTSQGRVHGIRYHNVIYIIWLDPHHNMNPAERFGGEKFYSAPLTPYQELQLENDDLKQSVRALQNEKSRLNEDLKYAFDLLSEQDTVNTNQK